MMIPFTFVYSLVLCQSDCLLVSFISIYIYVCM